MWCNPCLMPSVTGALMREVLLLHAWRRGSWHRPGRGQRVEVHVEDQLGLASVGKRSFKKQGDLKIPMAVREQKYHIRWDSIMTTKVPKRKVQQLPCPSIVIHIHYGKITCPILTFMVQPRFVHRTRPAPSQLWNQTHAVNDGKPITNPEFTRNGWYKLWKVAAICLEWYTHCLASSGNGYLNSPAASPFLIFILDQRSFLVSSKSESIMTPLQAYSWLQHGFP